MNKYLSVSNCCLSTWKGTKLIQFKNHKWSNKKNTSIETWLFIKHLKFQSCLTLKPIKTPRGQIFSGFERRALRIIYIPAVYQQFGWIQKATNTNQHIVEQWWDSGFTSRFCKIFVISKSFSLIFIKRQKWVMHPEFGYIVVQASGNNCQISIELIDWIILF